MPSGSGDLSHGSSWKAGAATRTITPEVSMWMAGFAARDEPSEGVEHDLLAKALALEDGGGNQVVIVSVDVLYIPRELREAVVERCVEEYGLLPESLMVAATHTHCSPAFREFDVKMYADEDGPYLERAASYRDRLEAELVSVVGDALADRRSAKLSYSHAFCGFAMNRRLPVEEGIAHVPNPEGPVDHEVPVLIVESGGSPQAILFGYACHTTSLDFNKFCGDWAGFAQRYVEQEFPDATALFLLGCAGDQNPYPRLELELAKQHGRAMANAVRAAVESRRRPVRGPLRVLFEDQAIEFEDPPDRTELEELRQLEERPRRVRAEVLLEELKQSGSLRTEYPYPVQAFGFGNDLTLIALGGEVLVEYALQLKEQLRGPLWVASYANAQFTYVPTTQAIYEGGYEGDDVIWRVSDFPSKWKPDVEERILRRARTLAERVSTPRTVK